MPAYEISVFCPVRDGAAVLFGGHVVSIFTVEVDQPIEWVRRHADEIARQGLAGQKKDVTDLVVDELAYNALMVREQPPLDDWWQFSEGGLSKGHSIIRDFAAKKQMEFMATHRGEMVTVVYEDAFGQGSFFRLKRHHAIGMLH